MESRRIHEEGLLVHDALVSRKVHALCKLALRYYRGRTRLAMPHGPLQRVARWRIPHCGDDMLFRRVVRAALSN